MGFRSRPEVGRILTKVVLGIGLGCLPIGCADSEDVGSPATSGELLPAEKEACARRAAAECEAHDRCSEYKITLFYGSQANCVKARAVDCEQDFALPSTGLTVEWLDACTPTLAAAACTRLFGEPVRPAACNPPPGPLQSGATCIDGLQCASGDCDLLSGSTLGCGHCVEVSRTQALGDSCNNSTGPLCSLGLGCREGKCAKVVEAGGACTDADLCTYGLPCWKGVCHLLGGTGEPCESDSHCKYFYSCQAGKCVGDPPKHSSDGDACGTGSICSLDHACLMESAAGGHCVPRAYDGEPCQIVGWTDNCDTSLVCQSGTCSRLPPTQCD